MRLLPGRLPLYIRAEDFSKDTPHRGGPNNVIAARKSHHLVNTNFHLPCIPPLPPFLIS